MPQAPHTPISTSTSESSPLSSPSESTHSAPNHSRTEQILNFLELFCHALEANATQSGLDSLIKDFSALKAQDLASFSTLDSDLPHQKQALALIHQAATLLRERVYAMLSQGQICHVGYLYTLILFESLAQAAKNNSESSSESSPPESTPAHHAPTSPQTTAIAQAPTHTTLPADPRFEPFIALAKSSLFAPHSSDGENALFITLYTLSKALSLPTSEFCLQSLMREYISLLCLLDINLPSSLEHSAFVVECFQALDITPESLIGALKAQLDSEIFFSYPPMRRRSILNWQLHCFWNVPHYFNHPLWLELYPLWRELFYTLLAQESVEGIDEAMYLQFFIYHICGNSFHHQQQWREFCEEIDKVAARHYESFARAQGIYGASESSSDSDKVIIGILRDRLVANSPYKVEISLLTQLLANETFAQRYEFRIYTMKLIEKSADDEAVVRAYEALGIKVIDVVSPLNAQGFYNSHLSKALALKNALNADGVKILISPNNGYGISDFLLASRSAPTQLYYSHGNFVYDLPCLDGRLTHICQNKRRITHEGFEFYGVPVKMLERFYNPPVPQEAIQSVREELCSRHGIGRDSVILGTIGRLTKLNNPSYWHCVIKIMQKYPNSFYLACGGGNVAFIQEVIEQSFRAMYGIDSERDLAAFMKRVCFAGYVDSAVYGHIIDVWLDSFPLEQGESRIEFVAKGGLSLVMSQVPKDLRLQNTRKSLELWAQIPHKESASRGSDEIERAFELIISSQLPLLAFSEEEYIHKGAELVGHFTQLKSGISESIEYLTTLRANGAKARTFGDEMKRHEGVYAFLEILAQP